MTLRRRFPHLGPRKLLVLLERRAPDTDWPAASTIGDILKRAGLVENVRRRRRAIDQPRREIAVDAPNQEWAADFKGWFRTRDQARIDTRLAPGKRAPRAHASHAEERDLAQPPSADAEEQQARFDAFRRHYNEERPHEALGQRPPAELYEPSPRAMPERIEDPWYDADHEVRRVRPNGEIKWRGELAFISEALADELVGLAELENGDHVVQFCGRDIGLLDRRGVFRRFAPARIGLRDTTEPGAKPKLSTISPVQNVDHQPG